MRRARGRVRGTWSCARRGSIRPLLRPTCALRPISGSRRTPRGRSRARRARRARRLGPGAPRVKDRWRAIAGRLRRVNRSIAARAGHSRELALRLTGEAGELLAQSIREARRLAARLRERARGRGDAVKRAAAERLERLCELAATVCAQIELRLAGKPISDRLVSIADPDARPIRKGKPSKPTEFGYVMQLSEWCEN